MAFRNIEIAICAKEARPRGAVQTSKPALAASGADAWGLPVWTDDDPFARPGLGYTE